MKSWVNNNRMNHNRKLTFKHQNIFWMTTAKICFQKSGRSHCKEGQLKYISLSVNSNFKVYLLSDKKLSFFFRSFSCFIVFRNNSLLLKSWSNVLVSKVFNFLWITNNLPTDSRKNLFAYAEFWVRHFFKE